MPKYSYRAKDGPDKTVDGMLEAGSRQEVAARLEATGLIPVWIREGAGEGAAPRRAFRFRRRVSARDVTVLTLQLASLNRSGVPILRGLRTIREQTSSSRLQEVVADIEAVVREGQLLSDGLARHPGLFSALYIDMVRAGESAGQLDVSLTRLAEAREKEDEVRRKVQAAVAYPVLVLAVGAVTVFVLLAFFLPRIIALYRDQTQLPLPTRILIEVSTFFSGNWHWFIIFGILLLAIVKRLRSAARGRQWLDGLLLSVPVVRTVILESDVGRFARTLALLLRAGVGVEKCLRLSGSTLRNTVLREEVEAVRRSTVEKGATLSEGFRRLTRFPSFVSNMTAVGEEGGRLDESLEEVAAFYEKQVEQKARLATSLIEPLLILVVGAIVGFIVAAMLLPVFQLRTGM